MKFKMMAYSPVHRSPKVKQYKAWLAAHGMIYGKVKGVTETKMVQLPLHQYLNIDRRVPIHFNFIEVELEEQDATLFKLHFGEFILKDVK